MHDKESLANELFESHVLIDSLKSEKEHLAYDLSKSHILIDSLKSEIYVLVEKSLSLENELNVSKELSQNSSSDNLKSFLYIEESISNKLSMIVDNASASTSHASNEFLNVELVNVKEAKANFSKTPSVKQTQGKFVLHVTIVRLLVILDQTVGNSKLLLREKSSSCFNSPW